MTKTSIFSHFLKFLFVFAVLASSLSVSAIAIDDTITPQNCERSNPACAHFMDTTSVGQIKWGGFIAGGLRSLTNLFVDGKLGVGTLRPSTGEQVLKVDVEGAVGAKFYCDENGNHCVLGSELGKGNSTTTGSVVINNGLGINITNNSNNNFTISIDSTKTQRRVSGICSGSSAIKQVNEDGTVVCQTVDGTTVISGGELLWATSTQNSANIYNRNAGKVGIGTNNPTSKLDVYSTAVAGVPGAKFSDNTGSYAWLNINGNGAEFYGDSGIYAHSGSQGGTGISALVYKAGVDLGETYGAKLVSSKVGSYSKGNIGLYATDMDHAYTQSSSNRDNRIPLSLANDLKQYAGYFDGNVNINGDLNITGEAKIGGKTVNEIVQSTYKIGEQCGVFASGVTASANVPCAGVNIYKGSGDLGEKKNYQCPANFILVGGDFQSPGNRIFFTCVRVSN